ncbi:MAG: aspartate kinase [Bacteroidales bacterium]|nr:aspartate kinase [Bacteroidales bacterium]
MIVMKFGGTSVGSAERMKNVARLIESQGRNIIVLSAMSGTTNSLVEIATYLRNKNESGARDTLHKMELAYDKHVDELYSTEKYREMAREYIHGVFSYLGSFTGEQFTSKEEKIILAQGELISTHMMTYYFQEKGIKAVLIPALDYMKTDRAGEPDLAYIKSHLKPLVDAQKDAHLFITQGFICRNADDEIDNLKRGGSDYTASLVGAALKADEIQIWTDIDGMHNNDPRVVEGTKPVRHLHFEEAAELGYFGAKILHPTCVQPAKFANVPVRLLNTLQPEAPGTIINNEPVPGTIKAVAAKDDITAIKIKSSRMLLAYGFLRKVFEIFESYRTSIDMICTSEVGVSLTIDNTRYLDDIVSELKKFGTVSVDRDMCIICVVGDMDWENVGFETRAMEAMKDIPVRMVCYGGSNYNISFLVKESDKANALKSLSNSLFD